MIAALSINQYQIKCSKEIIENTLSPFLRPQKIKKEQYMSALVTEVLSQKKKINKKRKEQSSLKMFPSALSGIWNIK